MSIGKGNLAPLQPLRIGQVTKMQARNKYNLQKFKVTLNGKISIRKGNTNQSRFDLLTSEEVAIQKSVEAQYGVGRIFTPNHGLGNGYGTILNPSSGVNVVDTNVTLDIEEIKGE